MSRFITCVICAAESENASYQNIFHRIKHGNIRILSIINVDQRNTVFLISAWMSVLK